MFEVKIETFFSAAHHLLNYKGNCENQHGHNWKVEVYVIGDVLDESNILVDFKILKSCVNDVVNYLDHKDLNQLSEFVDASPSSEIIAKFIYKKVKEKFKNISKVSVWETSSSCASYWE
jgi:6-pyruvoyltetrahydropterin/6-carboxytetrahydropterin synthase